MHMHEPIDVALSFIIAVLDEHARELELGAVHALARELEREGLGAADGAEELEDVAGLGVEVGVEQGQRRGVGVELGQAVEALAEQVRQQVGGRLRVQPEQADLPVVDEVDAARLDAAERGPDRRRHPQVARLVREPVLGLQVVDRDHPRVQVDAELAGAHGPHHAHVVDPPVGGFAASLERSRFYQGQHVHGEFLEPLRHHELPGRMVLCGEVLPVSRQDIDGLLRQS